MKKEMMDKRIRFEDESAFPVCPECDEALLMTLHFVHPVDEEPCWTVGDHGLCPKCGIEVGFFGFYICDLDGNVVEEPTNLELVMASRKALRKAQRTKRDSKLPGWLRK